MRIDLRCTAIAFLLVLPVGALAAAPDTTATPIKHVVVIYQENVSFDHYFATYPAATNAPGERRFIAPPGTPTVNGLSPALIAHNPNSAAPFRLAPSQAVTCDMDHEYKAEQEAFNGGLMDKFVEHTSTEGHGCTPNGVMAYFDGNTVTAVQLSATVAGRRLTAQGYRQPSGSVNLGYRHALSDDLALVVTVADVLGTQHDGNIIAISTLSDHYNRQQLGRSTFVSLSWNFGGGKPSKDLGIDDSSAP